MEHIWRVEKDGERASGERDSGERDSAERDAGAAYLYQGPMEGSYLTSDAAHAFFGEARNDSAGLGTRIADLDADGRGEVIIGAPAESSGGSAAGAVYLFSPP